MEPTAAELEAILHGAAVAPLSAPGYEAFARGFLRVTGSDATRWLNGMVTNSVQALQPGEGNYNFLLNAQGRIQADCTIYREPGEGEPTFLLETGSSQLEAVRDMLDRYIIMDDVELVAPEELNSDAALLLLGPKSLGHLHRTADAPAARPGHMARIGLDGHTAVVLASARTASMLELRFESNTATEHIFRTLHTMGAVDASPGALEAYRIYSGTPRFGTDIRDRDLPQETNQTHALHFSKGCYLGQEIVERIRSRGQVHRLLTRFRLEGDLPTSFPAPLTVDGKAAGELTSAAVVPLPEDPQIFALGYARREFLELKKQFTYGGGTAMPAPASQN